MIPHPVSGNRNEFVNAQTVTSEEEGTLDLPRPYILNVARIAKAKGHDLLLDAYKRVLDRFPDVHLVIGG